MKSKAPTDLSQLTLREIFRVEAENQTALLNRGLLELEARSQNSEARIQKPEARSQRAEAGSQKAEGRGQPSAISHQSSGLNPQPSTLNPQPSDLRPLASVLESLMRAAHSIKGAARIVNLQSAVDVAHAMEDCFVAAQSKLSADSPQLSVLFSRAELDVLLHGVDLLQSIAQQTDGAGHERAAEIQNWLGALAQLTAHKEQNSEARIQKPEAGSQKAEGGGRKAEARSQKPEDGGQNLESGNQPPSTLNSQPTTLNPQPTTLNQQPNERVLRLTAENLNRLLALAGEALVESRWLRPFSDSMQRLRRLQDGMAQSLEGLLAALDPENLSPHAKLQSNELAQRLNECRDFLGGRLPELDAFDRRAAFLSQRLYLEVLRARMRPFAEGAAGFPRMLRDLARSLGKEVRFELCGAETQVDREILERLEAPLTHLLRNAVDHGCETPAVRVRAGKPAEATVRLEARHSAGVLLITVADDGAGVDPERVRRVAVQKNLVTAELAAKLTETELLEFLFLPGFTLRESVTEISGRGVGLDVVANMVKSVRGSIRAATQPGRGTRFQLQLPITLSVVRTLLVEIGGEPYAFPLAQISATVKLPRDQIEVLEGRHFFQSQRLESGKRKAESGNPDSTRNLQPSSTHISLLTAHQVLGCAGEWDSESGRRKAESGNLDSTFNAQPADLAVVVLGDRNGSYGLIVDRLLGERELVVQPLDGRLGKVQDISAAALMEDGSPVLIVDVEDMVRSIGKLIADGSLSRIQRSAFTPTSKPRKKILAVDDSLTVCELVRKLLTAQHYQVEVAGDGLEAWNALRNGAFDLVITDVDMPRMDGIELTTLIRGEAGLKGLPVMIVSYKDRAEDRLRGLEAGADYYLTKGGFDDASLVEAVLDLIGEAEEE